MEMMSQKLKERLVGKKKLSLAPPKPENHSRMFPVQTHRAESCVETASKFRNFVRANELVDGSLKFEKKMGVETRMNRMLFNKSNLRNACGYESS